jgi:phage terminase large subunit-like protein
MDIASIDFSLTHDSIIQYIDELDKRIEYHDLHDRLYFRNYKPHQGQRDFHAAGLTAKERMIRAANRWGKSLAGSAEVSMHLTGCYPDDWNGYVYDRPTKFWVAGLTNAETFQVLKKYYVGDMGSTGWIDPSLIISENKQSHIYYIRHASGGISELRFKSYEQGRESFQGATIDGAHLDEEPPYNIYSETLTRTMATSPGHHGMIILTMTPLKGVTQMVLHFSQTEEEAEEGKDPVVRNVAPLEVVNSRAYISGTWDEASHLNEDEKKRMISSYSPHERDARTKGIPSIGSGLIYPVREEQYVISPIQIPDHWPRCFGLDFGWHHPTAAVFLAHDQDNDVVYAYAEYSASHLTPQHHAYQLIRQGADWMPGAYDHAGEASNQSDGSNVVDLYREAGLRYMVPADKRSVNKGIYTNLQRMENGKFKVFSTLHKFLTEIRMYARDENGKIKKGNDDLMDAWRYAMGTALPMARIKRHVEKKFPHHYNNSSSTGAFVQF